MSREPWPIRLAERGWIPDVLVRRGIRRLIEGRLEQLRRERDDGFLAEMRRSPVTVHVDAANDQHYEVPPAFFERVLGPRLKYSCALFEEPGDPLPLAEDRMIELTCARAEIRDGMTVLDLGCGWGSLSLWIAEHLPGCRVLAVSNSKPQREFILERAAARGLETIEVVTADVAAFDPGRRFDRIVSIEMFEHVRNWELLLRRLRSWLQPDGRAFLHVFCHAQRAYPFGEGDPGDWMGRNFFTGGLMPSADLISRLDAGLEVEERWVLDGRHYQRTAEAWLRNLDETRGELREILGRGTDRAQAALRLNRWRIFFMAVSELFGFRDGSEWGVCHQRLRPSA